MNSQGSDIKDPFTSGIYSPPSLFGQLTCRFSLLSDRDRNEVYRIATGRPFWRVLSALTALNQNGDLEGVNGAIRPFHLDRISSGEQSLLSLGEGGSDFIYRNLLLRSRRKLPTDDLHAVDLLFSDPIAVNEAEHLALNVFPILMRMARFPANYHGALLQDLDLRKSQGEQREFDEIISSHSFTYILAGQVHIRDIRYARIHDLKLFKNIIRHLKRGGVFRAWPVLTTADFPIHLYIKSLLDELLSEGWIRNHNFIMRKEPHITSDKTSEARYLNLVLVR